MEKMKNLFTVNTKLLPVKLHYFFGLGGYGGLLPFQSLIAKGLRISASAVGFTNTTLMVLTLLSKPSLGTMADYFRNIRIFLICLILLNIFSSLPLILMPPIEEISEESARARVQLSNSSEHFVSLSFLVNNECVQKMTQNSEITCHILQIENSSKHGANGKRVNELYSILDTDLQKLLSLNSSHFDTRHLHLDSDWENLTYTDPTQLLHLECEPDIRLCNIESSASSMNEYQSYQFWAFALIVILAGMAYNNTVSLSDCACYEVLGEQRHLYGHQRLFGSAGWALACLLSGYLSDHISEISKRDYSPGFYVMVCLMVIDAIVLCKMPLVKMKLSSNIYRDVKKVFQSTETILFAVGGIFSGAMASIVFYYELWYLQDLGASQSLLGWAITSQALIAETLFFLISGWFVNEFGPFNCLIISFAAYALRFGCYSIITNPIWALLIDITHGLTFALFHAAMTNFASTKAPEGVEGTMFGIFGGLIDGLGQAFGTLVCGVAFDKFGGRLTFTMASIFSAASAVVFLVLYRLTTMCSNRTKSICISSANSIP